MVTKMKVPFFNRHSIFSWKILHIFGIVFGETNMINFMVDYAILDMHDVITRVKSFFIVISYLISVVFSIYMQYV